MTTTTRRKTKPKLDPNDTLDIEGVAAHTGKSRTTIENYARPSRQRMPDADGHHGRSPYWKVWRIDRWMANEDPDFPRPGPGRWGKRDVVEKRAARKQPANG